MQAAIAEPTEGFDEATPGVFLSAVEARRRQVLASLDAMPGRGQAADLIFDLFSHLAMTPDAVLDLALFDSFDRRHRYDDSDEGLRLPRELGGAIVLRDMLTRGTVRGPALEAINALFTQGYAASLRPLDVVERRNFTLRVVAMLPGAERHGPFVLTDFLDVVCDEDDALRFWQIYVDRVAAEIAKRGGASEGTTREPWLLSRLLALHAEGPMAPRGAWQTLTRHVNRILQAHRHRWRFIRHLAEGCHEPRMLCYLCTSPAIVEDPEVIPVFLTRGNSRLVSCALLALYVYRDAHSTVDAALEPLRERPFAEIASRLVEIYGQLNLFSNIEPGSALEHLKIGVLSLSAERLKEAPLDALPNAVPQDSRSLRQTLLLGDVEPALRTTSPAYAQQYLERVVGTWFQTFTPSGVEHPLNDEVWRSAARRALCRLVQVDPVGVVGRIETFAKELNATAEKWAEGDVAFSHHLTARFVALFGSVWVGVCRALCAERRTHELGLAAYGTLIRVFGVMESFAQGSGGFGALEYVLPSLYPDILGPGEPDPDRVEEAAALVARIEGSLHAPSDLDPARRVDLSARSRPRAQPPESEFEPAEGAPDLESRRPWRPQARLDTERSPDDIPLLHRRPTRGAPLHARVWADRRPTRRWAIVLRTFSGWEVVSDMAQRLLSLLGLRRSGELVLTDSEVIVSRATTAGDRALASEGWSLSLDDVTGVRVEAQLRVFPWVLGTTGLLSAALLGGHLLFVGLRTDDSTALGWAAGLLLGGLAFDAALSRLSRVNARTFVLELHGRDARQTLRVVMDAKEGAEVLDAFMAHDAARRELEHLRDWKARPQF